MSTLNVLNVLNVHSSWYVTNLWLVLAGLVVVVAVGLVGPRSAGCLTPWGLSDFCAPVLFYCCFIDNARCKAFTIKRTVRWGAAVAGPFGLKVANYLDLTLNLNTGIRLEDNMGLG